MNFTSLRIVTDDVPRLITFYEAVTERPARRYTDDFAEIATPCGTVAIAGTRTLALFGGATARGAANSAIITEFRSNDVDAAFARLSSLVAHAVVQEPTTMPWGNRSLLFRDPAGNLVNVFTPVTAEAVARLDGR